MPILNKFLQKLYLWYGKKTVFIALGVIIVLIAVGGYFSFRSFNTEATEEPLRTIRVATANSLSGSARTTLVGTVEAVNQAEIQTETARRVISVSKKLGDTVRAGEIIAQLENANERAVVLQGEGAYEAALAGAAQSDISFTDAQALFKNKQSSGINTYRTSFTAIDDIVRNVIDDLFVDPDAAVPGFRLNSLDQAMFLNNERKAIEVLLDQWSKSVLSNPNPESVLQLLNEANVTALRISKFVETIAPIVSNEKNKNATIKDSSIDVYKTRLLTARTNLNATIQSIENARREIENASEQLLQAEIGGTSNQVSAANAAVKQALGTLRNAEANLEKTIIRAPISGTINELNIKTGDFVSNFKQVAIIANNNALEITTYVGESDRDQIEINDKVTIENKYEGTIVAIAPAVDTVTKKIEVKVTTESDDIANGDTVTIEIIQDGERGNGAIVLPITAIKFLDTNGSVFTIENKILVAHPVTLGNIRGSYVEITSGINGSDEIVIDARGLTAGQQAEAMQ